MRASKVSLEVDFSGLDFDSISIRIPWGVKGPD